MNYAKLIDGAIVYAPRKLPVGEYTVYNPTPEMLIADGWKPVVYTDPPVVAEGFVAVPGWEERENEIVQIWTIEQDSGEIDDSEALNIILGESE